MQCSLCDCLSPSIKLYVNHLRASHSKDPSFHILCGIGGCREVFVAFTAFNSHIYRRHRSDIFGDQSGGTSSSSSIPSPNVDDDSDDHDNDYDIDPSNLTSPSSDQEADNSCKESSSNHQIPPHTLAAANMILTLREGYQISQVAISETISYCKVLCEQAVTTFKEDFMSVLGDGFKSEHPEIESVLEKNHNPFENIESNYMFEKFCIDHLGCLEAEEIPFGSPYFVDKFIGNKHQKVSKTDNFYYVPLCSMLAKLLELSDYRAEVLNTRSSNGSMLADFCDGSLFQSHPLFSANSQAIQIIAYYDDLEVTNPLGSYTKVHKLGCLFFFLGNIRPKFRSTLKNIHLLAVGRSSDIQTYGINTFLSPFVEDLKKLYCDGISVLINGEAHIFHGALLAFLADTLAAHMVGGFKGSMSFALRVCRTCLITPQQLASCFTESACTVRTPETHFKHCSFLNGPLQAHYSTSYGVNFYSVLEDVPGFSVINGLPHDIMHDLYEGIVPYELKLLLCYCLDKLKQSLVL